MEKRLGVFSQLQKYRYGSVVYRKPDGSLVELTCVCNSEESVQSYLDNIPDAVYEGEVTDWVAGLLHKDIDFSLWVTGLLHEDIDFSLLTKSFD